jgi:uncharacterized FlgJ-related protein
MKKIFYVLCLLISFTVMAEPPGNVAKYRKFVDSVALQYQIPADLILGVGVCESGFGVSKHAKKLNNYFGIRGKYSKRRKTSYVKYAKPEESIVAFCELVTRKKFYAKLKGNNDPMVWVKALAKSNYAGNRKVWIKLVKRGIASIK